MFLKWTGFVCFRERIRLVHRAFQTSKQHYRFSIKEPFQEWPKCKALLPVVHTSFEVRNSFSLSSKWVPTGFQIWNFQLDFKLKFSNLNSNGIASFRGALYFRSAFAKRLHIVNSWNKRWQSNRLIKLCNQPSSAEHRQCLKLFNLKLERLRATDL